MATRRAALTALCAAACSDPAPRADADARADLDGPAADAPIAPRDAAPDATAREEDLLRDDFDGARLSALWQDAPCSAPGSHEVAGGALTLHTLGADAGCFLRSREAFPLGDGTTILEARWRLDRGAGLTAFFDLGGPDRRETLGFVHSRKAVFTCNTTAGGCAESFACDADTTRFVTTRVEVDAGARRYYVDGALRAEGGGACPFGEPPQVWFECFIAEGAPGTCTIDYVRLAVRE